MTRIALRRVTALTGLFAGLVLAMSCVDRAPTAPDDLVGVRVSAVVAGTTIDVLVVEVTAADIMTPLVFNLSVVNGVAQGTIRIPPGSARTITVRAYDTDGVLTHEGNKTIEVRPGQNPPVSISLVARAGQVDVTVTFGSVSVVVQPTTATVLVGNTAQLSVMISAANGEILTGPAEWATLNPAIAKVDQLGNVTAVGVGQVQIVATFAGVGGFAAVTVTQDQILFSSARDDFSGEIYVMNDNGTGLLRLTTNAVFDGDAAWSPDGTKIVFSSARDDFSGELYVMNADGTGVVRLTESDRKEAQPAWSPDGKRIAFTSDRDDTDGEIYVMNSDGTGVERVTTSVGRDAQPAWSPDGSIIAFTSTRDDVNGEIYVMNADGTNVVRLTSSPAVDADAAWSPLDGRFIAFTSTRDDGVGEIYRMFSDGTSVVRLTVTPPPQIGPTARDGGPDWSPDDAKIAFVSTRQSVFGGGEIYVMNEDGTGPVQVTDASGFGGSGQPRWRPRS